MTESDKVIEESVLDYNDKILVFHKNQNPNINVNISVLKQFHC